MRQKEALIRRKASATEPDILVLLRIIDDLRFKLRAERNDLEGRLNASLSEVAQISQTARGVVVSLPDILFDTNKATLKPNAQVALAKLAGIVSLVTRWVVVPLRQAAQAANLALP